VPYWYSGDDAGRVEELLRAVATEVEAATGLTAYDPQLDAPLLASPGSSAAVFDRVADSFAAHDVTPGTGVLPPPRRSWLDRLRRR
jgi:hypothetical protein